MNSWRLESLFHNIHTVRYLRPYNTLSLKCIYVFFFFFSPFWIAATHMYFFSPLSTSVRNDEWKNNIRIAAHITLFFACIMNVPPFSVPLHIIAKYNKFNQMYQLWPTVTKRFSIFNISSQLYFHIKKKKNNNNKKQTKKQKWLISRYLLYL